MSPFPGEQALPLRDIHPPAPAQFWPPAPGWWLLAILALVLGLLLGIRLYRRYRIRRRRRFILAELEDLGNDHSGPELAAAVSALLKRVALAAHPRAKVAALTGSDWLAFLDRHGGDGRFASGPGRVLAVGPYAPAYSYDSAALLDLARDWIRRNG